MTFATPADPSSTGVSTKRRHRPREARVQAESSSSGTPDRLLIPRNERDPGENPRGGHRATDEDGAYDDRQALPK